MKRFLLPAIICLCSIQYCMAQNVYRVKGIVSDTLIGTSLYLSPVVLLRAADTVIETFTRTAENGEFTLQVTKQGKYILQISRPGYADYSDAITLTDSVTDVGAISMLSKEHLLKEFVFTQQVAAIKIKGDTTEYVADSFKVRDGATIEDLLKKLPGIQVDKNGVITAQGVKVEKILVDGEEFFTDDPKVVTQGMQSAVLDKVQVFDKKSDQAEFTGIDDGEKTRTINLQLKENMKKGVFGKADLGGGTDGYYQEQLMANAFKGKRQLAMFGIASNTDKVGLGWREGDKYGGGNSVTEIGDDGSWTMYSNNFDEFSGWDGTYRGDGLPGIITGGGHFANKWKEDKHHASGSYRYANQRVKATGGNTKILALAGDTSRVSTETKDQYSTGLRHKLSGLYEWKIDSTTSIKLNITGSTRESETNSEYYTETYNIVADSNGARTTNDRSVTSLSNEQILNADLLLRKKFAKKGRSFSLDLKENYTDIKGDGFLKSVINQPDSSIVSTVDQRKISNSNSIVLSGKATYTEPLSKTAFLEANYGMTVNNSEALNSSFDRPPTANDYTVLRDSFSSNYRYNILINRGGLSMKFVYKTLNFSFGGDVSNSGFTQTDLLHGDTSHTYNYLNFFPKANLNYKASKQTSFNFSYNGNTKQPTISQIQPLNQNTDPLNIVTGNPSLVQEFTNRVNVRFNNYRVLTHRYIYGGLTFTATDNAISTSQWVDGAKYTTKYINVDGNYDADWYSGIGFRLKKPEIDLSFSFSGSTGKVNNEINGKKNVSANNTYSFGPQISYEKEDKYEFSWSSTGEYNGNNSTLNPMPINYWVFKNELSAIVQWPKDIETGTTADMMLRQETAVFTDNNSIIKWNAWIAKKFLKKKDLILKLSVFDILNQNLGYTRSAQGNMITQNNYNTIRRYGMLSLVWNFNFAPGSAAAATVE